MSSKQITGAIFALILVIGGAFYANLDRPSTTVSSVASTSLETLTEEQPVEETLIDQLVQIAESDPGKTYAEKTAQFYIPGTYDGSHVYYQYPIATLEQLVVNYDGAAAFVLASRVKNRKTRRLLVRQSVAWSNLPGALIHAARDWENEPDDAGVATMRYVNYMAAKKMGYPLGDFWDVNQRTQIKNLADLGVDVSTLDALTEDLLVEIKQIRLATVGDESGAS